MVEAAMEATRVVNRKARIGVVVSDKGNQTIIVAIERAAPHRLYHKVIRRTRRYPVHDPENAATVGDRVRIEECRPISKTKRWRLVEIVQEREVAQVAAATIDEALVSEVQRSAAHAADEDAPVAAAEPAASVDDATDSTEAPVEEAPAAEEATAVGVETEAPEADAAPVGDEVAGDEAASDEPKPEQQQ